jgi:hypothetical protein
MPLARLLTTLAEASTRVADALKWSDDVGPLSGKTILAVAAYFVTWAVLHAVWRRQNPNLRPILLAAAVLAALGIVGTFPTFFEAFAPQVVRSPGDRLMRLRRDQ